MASLSLSSVRTITITLAGFMLCAILVTGEASGHSANYHRKIRHRSAMRQHGAFTHPQSPAIAPKTTADKSFYLASEPQPPDVGKKYGQFDSDQPITQRSRTATKLPAQYSPYRKPDPQSSGQNTTARPEIPATTSKFRSIKRAVYFEEMLPPNLRPASSYVVKYDYNGIPGHSVQRSAISPTASRQASSHVAKPAVFLPLTTGRPASVRDASFQPAISQKAGTHAQMSFPVSKPAASPIAGPGAKLQGAASKPAAPPISSYGNRSQSSKPGLITTHINNSHALPPPTSAPKLDRSISSGLFPRDIPASVPSSVTPSAGYPLVSGVIQSLRGAQFRAFAGALESLHESVIRSGMTLFAPNDNSLSSVNINAATVADVLMRLHAVNQGAFNFSELLTLSVGTRLMTLSRFSVVITNNSANNFHVNNALVTFPDIYSADGVAVHGIDAVLDAYAYNGPPPVSTPRHSPTHPPQLPPQHPPQYSPHPEVPTQSPTPTDHKELPSPGPLYCTCPKLITTVCSLQCQRATKAPHTSRREPPPSVPDVPDIQSSAALSSKFAAASKPPSLLTAALLVLCFLSM